MHTPLEQVPLLIVEEPAPESRMSPTSRLALLMVTGPPANSTATSLGAPDTNSMVPPTPPMPPDRLLIVVGPVVLAMLITGLRAVPSPVIRPPASLVSTAEPAPVCVKDTPMPVALVTVPKLTMPIGPVTVEAAMPALPVPTPVTVMFGCTVIAVVPPAVSMV